MIAARLPQCIAAAHPLIADEDVLQREGQRVAHVQAARHIRRRHHDGEGPLVGILVRGKGAGSLPRGIVFLFDLVGPESLLQHRWPSSGKTQNFGLL
jgi:hypothetical protein